jgi:hypothetical protein
VNSSPLWDNFTPAGKISPLGVTFKTGLRDCGDMNFNLVKSYWLTSYDWHLLGKGQIAPRHHNREDWTEERKKYRFDWKPVPTVSSTFLLVTTWKSFPECPRDIYFSSNAHNHRTFFTIFPLFSSRQFSLFLNTLVKCTNGSWLKPTPPLYLQPPILF